MVLISYYNHYFRVKFSGSRTAYGVVVSFWVIALPSNKHFIDFSPFLRCADLAEIEIKAINREIKQRQGVNVNSNVVASSKRKFCRKKALECFVVENNKSCEFFEARADFRSL